MRAISLIFLLILTTPAQAVNVNVHCHKEQITTKDKNGNPHVVNTGINICESTPSDWKG